MKQLPKILAAALAALSLLPLPSRADANEATPAPARAPEVATSPAPAPVTGLPATAPSALSALPAPGRVGQRPASRFEALPEAEKEHIRKMAEFRKKRDAAEREMLSLGEEANKRKEAILAENEEAKNLRDRIEELKAEFAVATNAIETIYREDEKLAAIAAKIGSLQKVVDDSQTSLNHEVSTAMQIRMAAQRAAWEKAHPAPKPPEEAAKDAEKADEAASAPAPETAPAPKDPASAK